MGTTSFKGYANIGETSITEAIEANLIEYINWGFLELGAFYNINIPSGQSPTTTMHKLRCVHDPRYTYGQVWEAYRQNWVWESGLSINTQPIQISGVFVNDNFQSVNYYVDYIHGRVIFDTPLTITDNVHLAYSYKWVKTTSADSIPWFRKGQNRSFMYDDEQFVVNSGVWNDLADNRLQFPIVAIETVEKDYKGYQLGGAQYANTDIILHVLAEDPQTAKRISSILAEQNESDIYMYDPDRVAEYGRWSLDYRGEKTANPICYPDLIKPTGDGGFRYTNKVQYGYLRIYDSREQELDRIHENVYHSKVRWSTEVILHKI